MQFNTTAAVTSALFSAVIGFGLAFFIERKINRKSHTKAQKILVTVAMASFGYGLTAFLNEIIGFPLQGLQIRYDKLVGYFVANIVVLPVLFLGIVKLIEMKNKAVTIELSKNPKEVAENSFKYLLVLAGFVTIGYLGYYTIDKNSYDATYDFYINVNSSNCNSQYEDKPFFSSKFTLKKETNEIFMAYEIEKDGIKKQQLQKLEHCSVLNDKNWTCGGEWTDSTKSATYMFIDGIFSYEATNVLGSICPVKIVKR
jgi:hypothetical protein